MSSKDGGPPKKQDSRPGARKVSLLSAEQLERKRANDREAQRSIRQRTKGRIEQLESEVSALQVQITEMRPRSDRYDELLQQNNLLEEEVGRLKQQLVVITGGANFVESDERTGSYRGEWQTERPLQAPNMGLPTTAMLPSHFGSPHPPSAVPGAPSVGSSSNRPSHPQGWQQYNTRPPQLSEESSAEFRNGLYTYSMGDQMPQGPNIRVAGPQLGYEAASVELVAHQSVPPHHSVPIAMPSHVSVQPGPPQPYQQSGSPFQESSSQTDPAYPYR